MTSRDLTLAHAVAQSQLVLYLEGITPELAMRRPDKGGNPIHWILGHILAERLEAVELAGASIPTAMPDLSMYVTGSHPSSNPAHSFEELTALIPVTHQLLLATIESLTEAKLDSILPGTALGKPRNLGQELNITALHEMYHVGQISMLRRSYGLSGQG